MKNVRSYSCKLCLAEKCYIVKGKRAKNLINADSEIYGPCRHNTDFHRFLDPCTDEGVPPEKGKREKGKKTRKQKRKALRTLQVKSRGGGSELCTVIR